MDWGEWPFKSIYVSPFRSGEITFKLSFCKTLHFQFLRVYEISLCCPASNLVL